jgi:hypothetical protein
MKLISAIVACLAASVFFAGTVVMVTPSEAKKHYSGRSIAKHPYKSVRRAYKPHHVGYWVNGVWVATGLGYGVSAVTKNCKYYYRRWEETGNHKWKAKYNRCVD